jgi:integrase
VVTFTETKTRRDRIVPISPKLAPFLRRLPAGDGLVWDNGRGGYLYQESAWWKILNTAIEKCGIRVSSPRNLYTFRHTFCANLCLAGVPITVVKTIMGHSSILTTMRYAEHFYRDDRKAAVDRLPY